MDQAVLHALPKFGLVRTVNAYITVHLLRDHKQQRVLVIHQ